MDWPQPAISIDTALTQGSNVTQCRRVSATHVKIFWSADALAMRFIVPAEPRFFVMLNNFIKGPTSFHRRRV
jgi:hypothetical protein